MNPIKGLILDLDGTVCRGEEVIPSAPQAIAAMRAMGMRIIFLSNTIDSQIQYAARLERFGIDILPEDIIQAPLVLIRYLENEMPQATIFAIGEAPLLEALGEHFKLSEDPALIDVVVASFDRGFDYHKLTIGFQALKRGARFLATNVDATFPLPEGELPDAAAVIAALEACSKRQLELNVGKPSPLMLEAAMERLDLEAADLLLVGDRLETDILMGINAGIRTVLVLTGASQRTDLEQSQLKPDAVLDSIAELPGWIRSLMN